MCRLVKIFKKRQEERNLVSIKVLFLLANPSSCNKFVSSPYLQLITVEGFLSLSIRLFLDTGFSVV